MIDPPDHKPLFMVQEEEGGPWWLSDEPDDYPFSRPAADHEVTAEAMAGMLDQDAENANHHRFVGVHDALLLILVRETDPSGTRRVMRRLIDRGGLHNLNTE